MPRINFENIQFFGDAEIYFWHIEESCKELSELIADNGLSLAEAEAKFKSPDRQREWIAVRALLQNTPYKGKRIRYNSNGKPYLADSIKHISISHTQGFVAIAFSNTPIGIDIESTNRKAHAVIRSFLQSQEIEMLNENPDTSNEALRLWSAKEAAFKLASDKVSVLKEIGITKNANSYTVTYPDGGISECHSCIYGDIVISVATSNH